jgi:hypothetical protein
MAGGDLIDEQDTRRLDPEDAIHRVKVDFAQ